MSRFAQFTKLASASALAQLIPMLAAPLLTRWYGAAELGHWALFAALAANLGTVACARFEYAIVLPRRAAEAALVLRLSLLVALGVGILCAVAVGVALCFRERLGPLRPLGGLLGWLPPVVMLGGALQALTLWSNRQRNFGLIAQTRVLQQASTTALQLAAHAGGLMALVLSQVLGALLAPAWLWRRGPALRLGRWPRWAALKRLASRYRQFPLINSPHAFVNSLQETLVIAVIAALASPAAAGYYAITVRLVKAPASLVGGAMSELLLGELARGWQQGEDLRPQLRKTIRLLALVALPPAVVLLIWAPRLFGLALGPPWSEAGDYARWMTPYVWAHFIAAPLTVAPMVTGRQRGALVLSVVGNLIYVLAVIVALGLGGDLSQALAAISISMPLFFAGYLWWLVRGSVHRQSERRCRETGLDR